MKTLTISSDDEKSLQKVRELAEALNMPVQENETARQDQKASGKKVVEIFEEWHLKGGMITSIDDPVAWQRDQRKDRSLPFRE